jgi:hypothetical protein
MCKYVFVVNKGIKEVWYDGALVKRWLGNPLASDIAMFIYENNWHKNMNVADNVWREYLIKEIKKLINLK